MKEKSKTPVIVWLILVCAMLLTMVVVGGVTRLTHSGLSITDWQPIVGTIPPLSEAQWQKTFEKYQATPEYQKINLGMSLAGFKAIFFWEYLHRLLGRLVGVVFLIPFLVFWLSGRLKEGLASKLFVAFILGGLQGLMGWYMVKSGLVQLPQVSHYRLAAHLAITFLIFAYLFWILLGLLSSPVEKTRSTMRRLQWISIAITAIICLEVVYGAFVAGLKAGYGFNTFPKMGATWIPAGLLHVSPVWLNFLENGISIQFAHRTLAMVLAVTVLGFWIYARRFPLTELQRLGLNLLVGMTALQFLLGVLTLIWMIPISLAVLHQAGALLLFASALFVNYSLVRS